MELGERANRALLEETVRLQAELKAAVRKNQHGIGNERAERNQLSDQLAALSDTIVGIESKLGRVTEASLTDATLLRHLTERLDRFEKHSLNTHQDSTLKGNETSGRFDQLRHDIEDLRQQQRLLMQTQDKTLRSLAGDMGSVKSRMDRMGMETQELASDLKQRASRMEVELRGTVEMIGGLRADHSGLAGQLSALQVGVEAQLQEGKVQADEILQRMQHHDQSRAGEQGRLLRQISDTSAQVQAIEARTADIVHQASEAMERVRGSQSSSKAEVDERIAEVVTAQAQRLAAAEQALRQEMQAQDAGLRQALAGMAASQQTFEQDVTATAQQRARAMEARVASEAETLRSALKLAKFEAQQQLTALQKGIDVVDRHLLATRKNVEKVLKAEISLRKEGHVKLEQALREARQDSSDSLAALGSRLESLEGGAEAAHAQTRAIVKRDLLDAQERQARADTDLDTRFASLVARCGRIEAAQKARQQELDSRLTSLHESSATVSASHLKKHTAALSELQSQWVARRHCLRAPLHPLHAPITMQRPLPTRAADGVNACVVCCRQCTADC